MAWLDAIRGFAALCVVFEHASYLVLTHVRHYLYHWLDFGQYGVFVFFLVSGYIIPASLERKGSVRGFWIGRAFRLYPPYLLALVLSVIGYELGVVSLGGGQHHPLITAFSWLLMMPNLLSGSNVPNVTWTLSYEMVFYLVVAALFSVRAHRRTGSYAVACAIAALALGGVLPMSALVHGVRNAGLTSIVADALILAGVGLAVRGRRHAPGGPGMLAIGGACVAALTALTLLTVNQYYPYPWEGYTILAFMFTGTLVYRAEQGDVSRVRVAVIAVAVLGLTVAAGLWDGSRRHAGMWATNSDQWRYQWTTSLVLAAATFGLGLLVRKRRVPRFLAWLGLVSYSVYLLHPLVLSALTATGIFHRQPLTMQVPLFALIIVAVLACSAASYYLLEKPMQQLGRRIARRWDDGRQERAEPAQPSVAGAGAGTAPASGQLGGPAGTAVGSAAAEAVAAARSAPISRAVAGGSGGSP
jgi:peptidoglycan/LPS O-acetylase OafA/YrhL